MARLPSELYIINQHGGIVTLDYEGGDTLVRFDPSNGDETVKAQKLIHDLEELSDEDKCFAHFWSGYFYAHATGTHDL